MRHFKTLLISLIALLSIVGIAHALTVRQGDTLSKLAADNNTTVGALMAANPAIIDPNVIYVGQDLQLPEIQLGASTYPAALSTFNLAGAGIASSDSSITLQSLTLKQTGQKIYDTDLSDFFYFTLEPGNNTKQEIVECTTVTQNDNGTATLSGCSRGMSPIYPYTASTTLAFAHAGGSQAIMSDPPHLFNQYTAKTNDEDITGTWNFYSFPTYNTSTELCTADGQLCTKYYIDTVGAGGFTSANVGTSYGLKALGTSPETVGINLHNQSGLKFESGTGKFQIATSTESGLTIGTDGVLKIATTTRFVFSANGNTFTGSLHLLGNNYTNYLGGSFNIGYPSLTNATGTLNILGDSYQTGNSTTTGSFTVGNLGLNSKYYAAMPVEVLYASSSDTHVADNTYGFQSYTTPALGINDSIHIRAFAKVDGSGSGNRIFLTADGVTTTDALNINYDGIASWDLWIQNLGATNKNSLKASYGTVTNNNGNGSTLTELNMLKTTSTINTADGIELRLTNMDSGDDVVQNSFVVEYLKY